MCSYTYRHIHEHLHVYIYQCNSMYIAVTQYIMVFPGCDSIDAEGHQLHNPSFHAMPNFLAHLIFHSTLNPTLNPKPQITNLKLQTPHPAGFLVGLHSGAQARISRLRHEEVAWVAAKELESN